MDLIFPKRLEIELVSSCNLRCVYCPRRHLSDLSGFMDVALFKKIIDEASQYPDTIIVLHRRGESLLHRRFTEILSFIAGKFKEVQIATNATLLTEEKFEAITSAITFISFSLDAPAAYNETRVPAKYEDVERNILKFLAFNKGRVKTQASMVKTAATPDGNVAEFKEIWKDRVDRVRVYEEHSKDGVFGAIKNPRTERRPCVMPSYEMLIYDDGCVGRCNHDWNGNPLGDLKTHTIKEVWTNAAYDSLRQQHECLDITDPVCKNCDSWYPEMGVQGTGEVIEK
ncbi:MAG: radical SAM protein [Candidatus Magnetominusculus sp. LBB02]|nr:radical SAM protein [Candidatus Magnetominusculus sp. LBB02]